MRLTDRTVAGLALATGKGDRIHFDADLAGFGYRLRRGAGGRCCDRGWSSIGMPGSCAVI